MAKKKWYKHTNFWLVIIGILEVLTFIYFSVQDSKQDQKILNLELDIEKNKTEIMRSGLGEEENQTNIQEAQLETQKSTLNFDKADRLFKKKESLVNQQIKECVNLEDDPELNLNNYFLIEADNSMNNKDYEGAISSLNKIEEHISCSTFWKKTIHINESQFKEGSTKSLKMTNKVEFKIDNQTCYLGVVYVIRDQTKIKVCLTPQTILSVREEKKFDVNDDGRIDFSIKIDSIEGNRANITIRRIYQIIATPEVVTEKKEGPLSSLMWLFIGVILIVIASVIGIILLKGMKRKIKIS